MRARARMDVQAACEVTHDFTGAMAVSIFFLVIFVGLLLADGVLTYYTCQPGVAGYNLANKSDSAANGSIDLRAMGDVVEGFHTRGCTGDEAPELPERLKLP